jgi:hypothetical protein
MDEWSPKQVIQMLEGGNDQLQAFFERHHLSQHALAELDPKTATNMSPENVMQLRYKTKAAQFYRQQLDMHSDRIMESGPYRGRELSRRLRNKPRVQQHRSESTVE